MKIKSKQKKIDWEKVKMWQEIQHLKALQLISQGCFMEAFLESNKNPELEKLITPKGV